MIPECVKNHLYELLVMARVTNQVMLPIAWHYLVQDKYCLNIYNQNELFCQTINLDKNDTIEIDYQNKIYSDSAKFDQFA